MNYNIALVPGNDSGLIRIKQTVRVLQTISELFGAEFNYIWCEHERKPICGQSGKPKNPAERTSVNQAIYDSCDSALFGFAGKGTSGRMADLLFARRAVSSQVKCTLLRQQMHTFSRPVFSL